MGLGEEGRGESMVLDRSYAQLYQYPHAYSLSSTADPLLMGQGPPPLSKVQTQALTPTRLFRNANRIGDARGASHDQQARYPHEPPSSTWASLNNSQNRVEMFGVHEFTGVPMSVDIQSPYRSRHGHGEDRFLT